jgi:hypothetical protein
MATVIQHVLMARPIMGSKCSSVQVQPMGRLELRRSVAAEGLGRCKARMTIGHPGPRLAHRLFWSLHMLFSVAFFFRERRQKSYRFLLRGNIYKTYTSKKDILGSRNTKLKTSSSRRLKHNKALFRLQVFSIFAIVVLSFVFDN